MEFQEDDVVLMNKLKNIECYKSEFGLNHTIYSIKDKKMSFIIPTFDTQNLALKEFCRQANIYEEANIYKGGISMFKKNILDNCLTGIDITKLSENFYIIIKIVNNPFIQTIQNFLNQKSHNLTFREYVKSFKNNQIQEIISSDDLSLGITQYIIDEEFLVSGVLKLPNDPILDISNEVEENNIHIDLSLDIKNNKEYTVSEFQADLPLSKIKKENIDIFKTELFYDNEIKKNVLDCYIVDFEKYGFSTTIELSNEIAEFTITNYDDDYIEKIKKNFGADAEYVLKEEHRNFSNINKLKTILLTLKGEINTCEEQIKFKERSQNSLTKLKKEINEKISEHKYNVKTFSEKIQHFKDNEETLWNSCDIVIQKRLKEEKLFNETQKDFKQVKEKYDQLFNLEKNSSEQLNSYNDSLNKLKKIQRNLENHIIELENRKDETLKMSNHTKNDLSEILQKLEITTENVNQRLELLKSVDEKIVNYTNNLIELEDENDSLKKEQKKLEESLQIINEQIKNNKSNIKKTLNNISNMKKTLDSEKPLLNKDSCKLEEIFKEKKDKENEIEHENKTFGKFSDQLDDAQNEKAHIEKEINQLEQLKTQEGLNNRQKTTKRLQFQPEYDLKKNIFDEHQTVFNTKKKDEEDIIKKTKKLSLEKVESEKKLKINQNSLVELINEIKVLSDTINKDDIYKIDKKNSINKLENKIKEIESDIVKVQKENESITQRVQYYRQQLIKQAHIHTHKDKGFVNGNKTVNEILIQTVKQKNIDTIIDIGAKTGEFSKLFSNLSFIDKIYLFEPNYGLYKLLKLTAESSEYKHWNINNIAIMCDQFKQIPYYYCGLESSIGSFDRSKVIGKQDSIRVKNIPAKKLDDIQIDGNKILLKVDCGDNNIQTIQSMSQLLETKKIDVLCLITRDRMDNFNDFMLNFIKMYFKKYKSVMMPKYCMIFEDHK